MILLIFLVPQVGYVSDLEGNKDFIWKLMVSIQWKLKKPWNATTKKQLLQIASPQSIKNVTLERIIEKIKTDVNSTIGLDIL